MTLAHLLTHTAGLTYGFHHVHPVDALYRSAGFEFGPPRDVTLAEAVEQQKADKGTGEKLPFATGLQRTAA